MKPYHQLTREQRYQIAALREAGHNQSEIARVIGMHKYRLARTAPQSRHTRLSAAACSSPGTCPPCGQGALCVVAPALG